MGIENQRQSGDREMLATRLLADASERFDLDEVAENEELYRVLGEIQEIAQGETLPHTHIEIEGAEAIGFEHLEDFLSHSFSDALLSKALISRITIRPDIVHVHVAGKNLYLTEKEYTEWVAENPAVRHFKVRAENFTTFNTTGWLSENFDIKDAIPLPIIVYGFQDDTGETMEYLKEYSRERRESLYKLGTVAHEIAHHLFSYVLSPTQKEEFKNLADHAEPLTAYAKKYQEKAVYVEEQFCEAVRLLTTHASSLEQTAPKLYAWFKEHFPEITEYTEET